jgi:hypothetical protein
MSKSRASKFAIISNGKDFCYLTGEEIVIKAIRKKINQNRTAS